jgi:hypothetical protein
MSTLSDAYANTPAPGTVRKAVANSFRESPQMDTILHLQVTDPAAFDRLGATTRMAAALYAEQKRAAHE